MTGGQSIAAAARSLGVVEQTLFNWVKADRQGIRVGKERVQRLMQLHGIRAKGKRRFKVTTDSNHDLAVAPNLLDRQFTVAEPDKVWAGDITYIHTDEGWVFLAVVIAIQNGHRSARCSTNGLPGDRSLARHNRFDLNLICFINTSGLDVLRRRVEYTQ